MNFESSSRRSPYRLGMMATYRQDSFGKLLNVSQVFWKKISMSTIYMRAMYVWAIFAHFLFLKCSWSNCSQLLCQPIVSNIKTNFWIKRGKFDLSPAPLIPWGAGLVSRKKSVSLKRQPTPGDFIFERRPPSFQGSLQSPKKDQHTRRN